MPLSAVIDGENTVAPLVGDDEWELLRQRVRAKQATVALSCCGAGAFPRSSKLGTRHFVHRRADGCAGRGETYQHLWTKAEIVHACVAAGWSAETEVARDGWRADVLATRGSARVAFEVQWSPQDEAETMLRQQRYATAGVRGCWLLRGEAPLPARKQLPVFALRPCEGALAVVAHAGETYNVPQFVTSLLNGDVRFRERVNAQLRVSFVDMDCWKCRRPAHVYYATQSTRCGHEIPYALTRDGRGDDVEPFDDRVLTIVRGWLAGEGRDRGIRLGAIKRRYIKTVGGSYLSFGCPDCDAIFGDWFVRQAVIDAMLDGYACASFDSDIPMIGAHEREAHWCLPRPGWPYCG